MRCFTDIVMEQLLHFPSSGSSPDHFKFKKGNRIPAPDRGHETPQKHLDDQFRNKFEMFRWKYSSELPDVRLTDKHQQELGTRFKCRNNVIHEIVGWIEMAIMQGVITERTLIGDCTRFIHYMTKERDSSKFSTQTDIALINNILDQILNSLEKKQGSSSPYTSIHVDEHGASSSV